MVTTIRPSSAGANKRSKLGKYVVGLAASSLLEGEAHDDQIIVSPYTKTRIQDLFEMATIRINKEIKRI
jgi:hypothetical protein